MSRTAEQAHGIADGAGGGRHPSPRGRAGRFIRGSVATFMVAAGLTAATTLLTPGAAGAAPCNGTPVASCTSTGTISMGSGTLTLIAPGSGLSWNALLNGLNQDLVDADPAVQQGFVNDATGTENGWHVTMAATTFTNGTHTLPDTGTFSANGSLTSVSSPAVPSSSCVVPGACTLPANNIVFPVQITTGTGGPGSSIFNAAAGTGVGQILIGGSNNPNPIGWWVHVPGNAFAGAYTSQLTLSVVSAP